MWPSLSARGMDGAANGPGLTAPRQIEWVVSLTERRMAALPRDDGPCLRSTYVVASR